MASIAQICNMALSHIGSDARVSSISPPDGSVEAGHCATFYDLARTEMLEPGNWAFALKRASLSRTSNPSATWSYAYTKPSDCLRPLRVLRPNIAVTVFTQDASAIADDSDSAPFEIEGEVLYTNQADAVLVYTCDVTDSTKFTPTFTSALSYALASYLAGPVVKGNEGAKLGDSMRTRATSLALASATASTNAGSIDSTPMASVVNVRA